MQENNIKFIPFEPLTKNRFIINFLGNDLNKIPEYLFNSFKLKNVGDDFILTVKMYESTLYSFNPKDVTKITDVKIDFLDPVGTIVNSLLLPVKGTNFFKSGNYAKSDILINKFRFIIDLDKIKVTYKNIETNE